MEVEQDTKTIFASPLEDLKEVLPGSAFEEGLAVVSLDSPEANGNANPVQASTCYLGNVRLRLQSQV